MRLEPALAVMFGGVTPSCRKQLPVLRPLGVAITNPAGNMSVSSMSTEPPGMAKFACVSSNTKVELLPCGIVLGEKAIAIENELPLAVNVSVAVPPVPLLALTLPVVLV
jgi:hypothetical protein